MPCSREARAAKAAGASRFCMGAAWRSPKDRDLESVCAMVEGVKALGLETCATLGMLTAAQAQQLRQAGLDYYNHNLDTSPEFYEKIITTRTYQDRLETLEHVRDAGIHVCCGGIVGMGETREDRIGMIATLASLPEHPESVPINMLVRVAGTPLAGEPSLDPIEFVRTIAVARITMPRSMVRLSAGRETMSEETQALCFLAGANSIFYGPKLLTTPNPGARPRPGADGSARSDADGGALKHPHALARHSAGEHEDAERHHRERGADLDAAQNERAVAVARRGKPLCRGLGGDGERGDRRDGDRRADAHHEGRGDAGPEQALRQCEDEDDDRTRAGPHPDGDDRRQTAAPAARPRQFLRLRPMRVPPGQHVLFFVGGVMMAVGVIVMGVVVVRMIMVMAIGVGGVHVGRMVGRRFAAAGSGPDLTACRARRKPRPFTQISRAPNSTISV